MKKIALAAAALLFSAGSVFAAEGSLSFTNKLSSNIVNIEDGGVTFDGFTEKAAVNFDGERLDFGLTAKAPNLFGQSVNETAGVTTKKITLNEWKINEHSLDWYVEFRPWTWLTLGWNDDVFAYGAYLPVEDDNVATGNIATENGFALVFRPIQGLRIGTGVEFGYPLLSTVGDNDPDFKLGWSIGADFTSYDVFSIGASARNILSDERSFGGYVRVDAIDSLTLYLGYTYNGELVIKGDHYVNLGAEFEADAFSIGFDFAFAAGGDAAAAGGDDLYIGLAPAYAINDNWGVDLTATALLNFGGDGEDFASAFSITPEVTYGFNSHEFGLGFEVDIEGSSLKFAIPVYWKYSFKN